MRGIVDALSLSVTLVNRRGIERFLNGASSVKIGRAPRHHAGDGPADLDPNPPQPGLTEAGLMRIQEVVRTRRPVRVQGESCGLAYDTSYLPVCDLRGRVSHVVILDCDPADGERAAGRARRDVGPLHPVDATGSMETPAAECRRLTPAETEVLQLIVGEGMNNREIAEYLHRSERTVESHRERIMRKLRTHNAVDLVKQAISLGLVTIKGQPSS